MECLNQRDIFWTDFRGIPGCSDGTMREERTGFGVQLFDHDGERWLRLIKIDLLLTVRRLCRLKTKVCEKELSPCARERAFAKRRS